MRQVEFQKAIDRCRFPIEGDRLVCNRFPQQRFDRRFHARSSLVGAGIVPVRRLLEPIDLRARHNCVSAENKAAQQGVA